MSVSNQTCRVSFRPVADIGIVAAFDPKQTLDAVSVQLPEMNLVGSVKAKAFNSFTVPPLLP
jgi:hypothetical protein